jgi:sporulation protein YlmC with PRC-barrel domain
MKTTLSALAFAFLATTAALAQQPSPMKPPAPTTMTKPDTAHDGMNAMASAGTTMTTTPGGAVTVTNYYKQSVYDNSDKKIGEVSDVLIDTTGKINALMISIGGFLGIGDKDVAVPFQAVHSTQKDGKWYLVMDTTKDALKTATGYKYEPKTTTWVPEKS